MVEKLKGRILLVDDEDDFLKTLADRLKLRGLDAHTAASGEEAILRVQEHEFDTIVVDLSMPGIDGIETIERIKAINPTTEIIMLTGHATVESGVKAMKTGAGDFLQKPVDMPTLLEKIGEAQNRRTLVLETKSQEVLDKILKSRGW